MSENESVYTAEIRFFDPKLVKVTRDDFGKLMLTMGEEIHENISPARTYPLSDPTRNIGLMDKEGKEIGLIREITEIEEESMGVLEEELALRYFTPQILAIRKISSRFGMTTWEVETDRGFCTIHIKDRNDMRRVSERRIILSDVHGAKYEIRNTSALDARSLNLLETEV